MTYLVVALDGPEPFRMLVDLHSRSQVRWFKTGPLTLLDHGATLSIEAVLAKHREAMELSVFHDAKLADHGPYVCEELAKRLGGRGYASLSTSTDEATEAAVRGAEGSTLRVWRHVAPTSQSEDTIIVAEKAIRAVNQFGVHGVICGAWHANKVREYMAHDVDIVCPAVRLGGDGGPGSGHFGLSEPRWCVERGVTHAVVGRPIWTSTDPAAAARRYVEALR